MTVQQQILEYLKGVGGVFGCSAWNIARRIERPEPSVRRSLINLYDRDVITRTGDRYYGYRYKIS